MVREMEVNQVGIQSNVSDIGTKPLSRQRLCFLLYWLSFRDAEGNPVGEEEATQLRDVKASKAKIMELAKFIQRVTALSGLELVAGQSCEIATEKGSAKMDFEILVWQWLLVVAILVVCVMIGFLWFCFKHHRMRRQLEDFHRLYEARAMADEQFRTEMKGLGACNVIGAKDLNVVSSSEEALLIWRKSVPKTGEGWTSLQMSTEIAEDALLKMQQQSTMCGIWTAWEKCWEVNLRPADIHQGLGQDPEQWRLGRLQSWQMKASWLKWMWKT